MSTAPPPVDGPDRQPALPAGDGVHRLAVAPGVRISGVYAPAFKGESYDWRVPPGEFGNTAGIRAALEVGEIGAMLTRRYPGEAFAVGYLVHGPDGRPLARQPRVNKSALPWLRSQGFDLWLHTVIVEGDNEYVALPDGREIKRPWTADAVAATRAAWARIPLMRAAATCFSRGGWRAFWPLARPVVIEDAEDLIAGLMRRLAHAGLRPDWKCGDYTRFQRAPCDTRPPNPDYPLELPPPDLAGMARFADLSETMAWSPGRDEVRPDPAWLLEDREYLATIRRLRERAEARPPGRGGAAAATAARARVEGAARPTPREPRPLPEGFAMATALAQDTPPARVAAALAVVAAEVAAHGSYHTMFRALAGALCRRGAVVPLADVPAVVAFVAARVEGADVQGNWRTAAGTVARFQSGLPVEGYGALRRGWPELAAVLDGAAATSPRAAATRAQQAEDAALADDLPTLDELAAQMHDAMSTTALIPSVMICPPGSGKTFQAIRIAVDNASRDYEAWAPGRPLPRAPEGTKSAIVVPSTRLALEVVGRVRALDWDAARLFSPASLLGDDGAPVCRFPESARALAGGGQSVRWTLCEGRGVPALACPHREGCAAYAGRVGPESARVTVATAGSIAEADAAAGAGTLFWDEPASPVVQLMLSAPALAAARQGLECFERRYADAMRPALRALERAVQVAPLGPGQRAAELVGRGLDAVAGPDLVAAARGVGVAPEGDLHELVVEVARAAAKDPAAPPPLDLVSVRRARENAAYARVVGDASRALCALQLALAAGTTGVARVLAAPAPRPAPGDESDESDDDDAPPAADERVLHLTWIEPRAAAAYKRRGPLVLMDAGADLLLPAIRLVLGGQPRVHAFAARDGAPVTRALIEARASRSTWLHARTRRPVWATVARGLSLAIDWMRQAGATRLGIVTYASVAAAIALVRDPQDEQARAAWRARGLRAADVAPAAAALGPVLARWPGLLRVGHYGAMRGLDAWYSVDQLDGLATLGDPWENMDALDAEVAYLNAALSLARAEGYQVGDDVDRDAHWERKARVELEQAHGRLRAVRRTKPAFLCHVGHVVPGGWTTYEVVDPIRNPISVITVTAEQLRAIRQKLGGTNALASLLGCSVQAVDNYCRGKRTLLPIFVEKLRDAGLLLES